MFVPDTFSHVVSRTLGIITTGFGILCFFIIPTDPQSTRMLNEEERSLALARIDADQVVRNYGRKERTTVKLVLRSFSFSVRNSYLNLLGIRI